jgi:hypothetical protein
MTTTDVSVIIAYVKIYLLVQRNKNPYQKLTDNDEHHLGPYWRRMEAVVTSMVGTFASITNHFSTLPLSFQALHRARLLKYGYSYSKTKCCAEILVSRCLPPSTVQDASTKLQASSVIPLTQQTRAIVSAQSNSVQGMGHGANMGSIVSLGTVDSLRSMTY